jgi:hypothetical protein
MIKTTSLEEAWELEAWEDLDQEWDIQWARWVAVKEGQIIIVEWEWGWKWIICKWVALVELLEVLMMISLVVDSEEAVA